MDKRTFGDVEQMNEFMIYQWNSRVRQNDEVYILGDFSFGNGEETNEILRRLKGRKYLIEGNHDYRFLSDANFDHSLFKWAKPYYELKENHKMICLCHYPIMCYNGQYRLNIDGNPKSFMVYGHVHDTMDETLVRNYQLNVLSTKRMNNGLVEQINIPCNMINCFCVFSNYVPLTLNEWHDLRLHQLNAQQETNKYLSGNTDMED